MLFKEQFSKCKQIRLKVRRIYWKHGILLKINSTTDTQIIIYRIFSQKIIHRVMRTPVPSIIGSFLIFSICDFKGALINLYEICSIFQCYQNILEIVHKSAYFPGCKMETYSIHSKCFLSFCHAFSRQILYICTYIYTHTRTYIYIYMYNIYIYVYNIYNIYYRYTWI